MTNLSITKPAIGQPNSTEDVDIVNAFTATETWANGNIDSGNLTGVTRDQLGISDGSVVRRGTCMITTSEQRTSTSYGFLTTHDKVENIVLPTNGLIAVAYYAMWQNSAANEGRAAIFLNSDQLKVGPGTTGGADVVQAAVGNANGGIDTTLNSYVNGLINGGNPGAHYFPNTVTTGHAIADVTGGGGICHIFAAAGTYTVGVQFKAMTGANSVTVKQRKLWVWTIGF